MSKPYMTYEQQIQKLKDKGMIIDDIVAIYGYQLKHLLLEHYLKCISFQSFKYSGKRDYFSVVIAFRYMLDKKDFLIYKKELVNLILKVTKETHQIPIERLLGLMGMPVNWKDITRYTHI